MSVATTEQTTSIRRCALCKVDRKGRFILANQEAQRLFGLSEVELFGKPFVDFLLSSDRQAYLQLIKNRNPYDTGYDSARITMVGVNGQPIPVTLFVSVNFGGGNPANYQVVIRPDDPAVLEKGSISSPSPWEYLARLLLSDSDPFDVKTLLDLLRAATEAPSIAVYDLNESSSHCLAFTGSEPTEPAADQSLAESTDAGVPNEVRATFSLSSGHTAMVRFILEDSSANQRAGEIRGRAELAAELIHAIRPPSLIDSAVKPQPASVNYSAQILDQLKIGYVAFDDCGNATQHNQTFESILNPPAEFATQHQLIELIGAACGESAASAVDGYLAALASSNCLPGFKATYEAGDGSTICVEGLPFETGSKKASCCFLFYEAGGFLSRPKAFQGVSPQVGTVAIDLLKSTVAAATSVWQKLEHEHHNQLSGDGGFYLGCLSHHLETLDGTLSDLERMLRLIWEDEETQVVDLDLLVTQLASELTESRPGYSFVVRHSDLPKIHTHLRKITSVLRDVLAVSTLSGSERKVEVTVTTSVENEACVIWVRDNGSGLTVRQRKALFTLRRSFAHGKSRHPGGLAAGLALAKEIAVSLNGALELESRPGKGTIVKITFPIDKP